MLDCKVHGLGPRLESFRGSDEYKWGLYRDVSAAGVELRLFHAVLKQLWRLGPKCSAAIVYRVPRCN